MWERRGLGMVAALSFCTAAAAQTTVPARSVCSTHLVPAFEKESGGASTPDCACIAGFLTGRYGTGDAEIIVRMLAAASTKSDQEMERVSREIGLDRIRALKEKVGQFQPMARDMDEACPELKKP